jgi:tellurite resistance protein
VTASKGSRGKGARDRAEAAAPGSEPGARADAAGLEPPGPGAAGAAAPGATGLPVSRGAEHAAAPGVGGAAAAPPSAPATPLPPAAEVPAMPGTPPPPAPEPPPAPPAPSLAHLPLPLFAVPMGLGGLGLLWRETAFLLGPAAWLGEVALLAATLAWVWLAWLHGRRALAHPEALAADLADPLRLPFLGAPTIGLMLVGGFLGGYLAWLGAAVWLVAVSAHLAVAAWLFGRILAGEANPAMLAPPLLIPMVGNILAPAVGGGFGFLGLAAVTFGVGAFLWLAVTPLLLHRMLAGPALPPRLAPSLAILLAPPSVAAVSLATLTGESGLASLALFGVALLTALALLAAVPRIAAAPFSPAFWGLSFPTAAFGIALSRQVQAAPGWAGGLLTLLVLAAVTALILWLCWRTAQAARSGAFLRPH